MEGFFFSSWLLCTGRTPLHWAIDLENIAMARVLIPHMEDVNLQVGGNLLKNLLIRLAIY